MRPSARSLTLDLLSTLRRGAMPVRALVEAGALFGIEANAIRVAVARLLAEGLLQRDERGRYRLGDGAGAIGARVRAWRDPSARMRPWSGAWLTVIRAGRAAGDRAERRRGEAALRLLGFRQLAPHVAVRPDNLAGGTDGAREALAGLGLDPASLVGRLDGLDAQSDTMARRLWDVAGQRRALRSALAAVLRSERRLARLDEDAARVESFLVGGGALRVLNLDPLLPEEIQPAAERDALAAAMRRYDRLGRIAWASLLRAHGVPHVRAAADLRMGEAADALSAAGGIA